jgi:nicotinate dehydrogenase subunit B
MWRAYANPARGSPGCRPPPVTPTRRQFLRTSGALVIAFRLPSSTVAGQSLSTPDQGLDGWIQLAAGGEVIAYCGKVELGTGIRTAFTQLIAEELDLEVSRVTLIMGDTALCPDQGPTVGSASLLQGGAQVRQAAAEARTCLLEAASKALRVPVSRLTTEDGTVVCGDGRRISYGQLLANGRFKRKISGRATLKAPSSFSCVGTSVPRVDLPAKVFGTYGYVHNLRIPGMLHGRVIRPPGANAAAVHVDASHLPSIDGLRILQNKGFVGVVASREEDAVRAAQSMKVDWRYYRRLPAMADTPAALRKSRSDALSLFKAGDVAAAFGLAQSTYTAEYYVPHQMHASIGPSCAVADVRDDHATLWSATQSSFLTRNSIAALLGMEPSRVRLIWAEGSGCYGHNGVDDCTADAALLSQLSRRPVRVQWMRQDEHGNEPKGAAMTMSVRAVLTQRGDIAAWDYQVWSPSHTDRPAAGGSGLLAGEQLDLHGEPFMYGAQRNAQCTYVFPNQQTTLHQVLISPTLRVSSLRGLGSPQNTFANESFMDELALRAGADPIEYRIRHLKDDRAVAVLRAVAELSKWGDRLTVQPSDRPRGRGVAFVNYDNTGAYVAVVVHVEIDKSTGKVHVPYVAVAHDCGLIVNPDGLKNQIEGNVIQALSRALMEEVRFDKYGVTSLDWRHYEIMRFQDVPNEVAITLLNRVNQPIVGAGEATSAPVAAALANAIYDACSVRLRAVPFLPSKVLSGLSAVRVRRP